MLDPVFNEILKLLHLNLDDDLVDVRVAGSLVEVHGCVGPILVKSARRGAVPAPLLSNTLSNARCVLSLQVQIHCRSSKVVH